MSRKKKNPETETKRCCARFHEGERVLPIDQFNKSKGRQGRFNWCKKCQAYYAYFKRHNLPVPDEKVPA